MEIPELLPGDIILSRSNAPISRLIRWFGKKQTGNARVSHAAMAVSNKLLTESLFRVTVGPIAKYHGQPCIVYRMVGLSDHEREMIALKAVSVEGKRYGWAKIPLFALDSLFRTYLFTSRVGVTSFKVCSELIAWAYEKTLAYKPFGLGWRSISPDIIDDYCSHSAYWNVIYDNLA